MQRIGWSPLHIGGIHKLNRPSLLDTFMSHIEAIKQIHDLHGMNRPQFTRHIYAS